MTLYSLIQEAGLKELYAVYNDNSKQNHLVLILLLIAIMIQ